MSLEKNLTLHLLMQNTPILKKYINVDLLNYVSDKVLSWEIPRKRMGYRYFLFVAQALFVNSGADNYKLIKNTANFM